MSRDNRRTGKGLYLFIFFLIGLITIFIVRPQEQKLPVLDQTEPFTLDSIEGERYQSDNGKVKLLTFFYTKCPDVCPLTMVDFKDIQEKLQTEGIFGSEVELLAVTLDPEVDTVPVIKKYAEAFDANPDGWKFLRGTPNETKEIADVFHMKFKKTEGDFIAHNTTMFLLDQNNQIRGLYDMANQDNPVQKDDILEAMFYLAKKK